VDNPFRLKGMNEAVTRLRQALRTGESIAVYGDYDVDGVAATALLVPTLRAMGGQVIPYIPNRMEEGYGLNEPALTELARQGVKLVITVDCGVRSIDEALHARRLGLDLIITDHHAVGESLPEATAVIDPKRPEDDYPFKHLSGVGLAFKLAQATLRVERQSPVTDCATLPDETELLDLVALGTIADLAPLVGENRALVSSGLQQLNEAGRPGVAAMLREAGIRKGEVSAGSVGFVLGPRLNASGRLDDAKASYRLLTTSDEEEADALAQQLGIQNRERRRLTEEMVQLARRKVSTLESECIYILADASFMSGIAGLVASRIVEEYYRPTLVIALEENKSKGSARSIRGFHITQALDECTFLLERHGGHSAAAGFTIRNENIDAFRQQMQAIAARELRDDDFVSPLRIDAELHLHQANGQALSQLELLQPFGMGNPRPTFASYGVQVRDCRSMGADGAHLKLKLSDGVAVWDAVAFRQTAQPPDVPHRIDVAYSLQSHTWNGQEQLQLVVEDWCSAQG